MKIWHRGLVKPGKLSYLFLMAMTLYSSLAAQNFTASTPTSISVFAVNSKPALVDYAEVAKADKLKPGIAKQIDGFIGEKLQNAATNRVFAQDVNRLIEPFRHRDETRCWQTEFWGKWFTSAVLAYRYQPTAAARQVLDNAVAGLIATQSADGYIGNYKPANLLQQWDIWGRKYCLLGLLDYYDITNDKKTLNAASALADNLLSDLKKSGDTIVTKGNHRGMAASSVLEPLCLLYRRTNNPKYLVAAEKIVSEWETPSGPQLISKATIDVAKRFPNPGVSGWFSWNQGQKSYEMMSCYEGLLELYRITGNSTYRKAVEDTWQNILETEINAAGSGSAVECWFGGRRLQVNPVFKYQETCVTVTWIKLSQQLLRLTGEARYAEAIETAYYNALLGAMSPDGKTWAQYTPLLGKRMEGEEHCNMGLNCCIASGPRGLFTLPHTVVMSSAEGLNINFFVEGKFEAISPRKQKVSITQKTTYPKTGTVVIDIDPATPENFSLNLRVPAWSTKTKLSVNGEQLKAVTPGGYASINRQWKKGDQLILEMDMNPRIEVSGESPAYISVKRGPVLFARDTRLGGPELTAVLKPEASTGGKLVLSDTASGTANLWMEVTASFTPETYPDSKAKPVTIRLCDYASAGNGAEPSYFLVWMPQLVDPRLQTKK